MPRIIILKPKRQTHVPEASPTNEIGMIDLALRIDVLPRANHHRLCRGHVDQRRFSWICMRDPQ